MGYFITTTQDTTKTPSFHTQNHINLFVKKPIIMDSTKNAANYVSDKVNEATSGASKAANKEVAKDSNVDVSTRASAAKDALGDKADEHKHGASAEANKQRATH